MLCDMFQQIDHIRRRRAVTQKDITDHLRRQQLLQPGQLLRAKLSGHELVIARTANLLGLIGRPVVAGADASSNRTQSLAGTALLKRNP